MKTKLFLLFGIVIGFALALGTVADAAFAPISVPAGGTASTTLTGILAGNGTSAVQTVVIGSNLTFSGGTLSASGGGGSFPFTSFPSYNGTTTPIGFNGGLFTNGTTTFTTAPIFTALSGIIKGNGSSAATVAANGTDFSLISALDCTGTGHLLKVTATGTFTCSADSGGGGGGGVGFATTTLNTESIQFYGKGYVGIGTTTPAFLLSLATSSASQLSLSDGTNNPFAFRAAGGNLYLATSSAANFATSTTPVLTIDASQGPSGYVGFGNSTPAAAFDANLGTSTSDEFSQISSSALQAGCYQNYLLFSDTINANNAGGFVKTGTTVTLTDVSPFGVAGVGNAFTAGANSAANATEYVLDSSTQYWSFGIWLKSATVGATTSIQIAAGQASGTTTTSIIVALTPYYKHYAVTANVTNAHTTLAAVIQNGTAAITAWGAQLEPGNHANPHVASTITSNIITSTCGTYLRSNATVDTLTVNSTFNISNQTVLNTAQLTAGAGGNITFNVITGGKLIANINRAFGIGTTTPFWMTEIASSTAPQLALDDTSLTSDHWTFRNAGGNFYLATASPTTFATSSVPAFTILDTGSGFLTGIGKAVPTSALDVTGSGSFTATVSASQLSVSNLVSALIFTHANGGQISTTNSGGNITFTSNAVGIGTTTPQWKLQVATSTAPQLALSDGSLTSNPWDFRSINSNLYIATSSPSTFATSSLSALTIGSNGMFAVATTTLTGILNLGNNPNSASSTISTGAWQIDGYNAAGTRTCTFLVGTTLTTINGACNN